MFEEYVGIFLEERIWGTDPMGIQLTPEIQRDLLLNPSKNTHFLAGGGRDFAHPTPIPRRKSGVLTLCIKPLPHHGIRVGVCGSLLFVVAGEIFVTGKLQVFAVWSFPFRSRETSGNISQYT